MTTERELSYEEANDINDKVDRTNITDKEYHEHGFDLTAVIDGRKYRLSYDHETWFTDIAYEVIE